jgi:hypothetical protein
MKKTSLIFLFFVLLISAMVFGLLFSRRQSKETGTCIECHAQIIEDDSLSAKARGPTELIFFHSTHSYSQKGLSCVDCHGEDPHTKNRPEESFCLGCHSGKEDKPSNECMLCHANPDKLSF